jgi:hypothetical protein
LASVIGLRPGIVMTPGFVSMISPGWNTPSSIAADTVTILNVEPGS